MKRRTFTALAGGAAAALGARIPVLAQPAPGGMPLDDLRFGHAPLPASTPGFDPAGDAKALMAAGLASPAAAPVPGRQYTGSYATGQRYVVRVPRDWNGDLVVAGTAATRSEFANDLIWSDYLLSRGYAFASSNKGIPYNAIVEPIASSPALERSYVVPFDLAGLASKGLSVRFGMLQPATIGIAAWNDDLAQLTRFAKDLVRSEIGRAPARTFAVGISNGGAQVRSLLERHPELIDGGVDWEGPLWTPEASLLDWMPRFLAAMPAYVRSAFADPAARAAIEAAGYPPDRRQPDAAHPSLYGEFYSYAPSFYADLTVFAYATLIDPDVRASVRQPAWTPNPADPQHLPGTIAGSGIALPERRAAYAPSPAARRAIAAFAHTGRLERPLISTAGTADAFIPPLRNAVAYADLVRRAGRAKNHRLFLIEGATHVDTFVAAGYGLRPHAPFAWAAFEALARDVREGRFRGGGPAATISQPADLT